MLYRRCIAAILVLAAMAWPPSPAAAAVPFPCSDSLFAIDEAFIPGAPRVCFELMDRGAGTPMFTEELVVESGSEYLSFVVARDVGGGGIRYKSDRIEDWLPAAYEWVARGATDWGEQLELETNIGAVAYMGFSAEDGTACVGFRLYYGHRDQWARIRATGVFCDANGNRLGAPHVQRIFDMVKFSK